MSPPPTEHLLSLKNIQRTPAVPYALLVLQEAYTKLDMLDLAQDATRVYELNYPNGPPVPEHQTQRCLTKFGILLVWKNSDKAKGGRITFVLLP